MKEGYTGRREGSAWEYVARCDLEKEVTILKNIFFPPKIKSIL
jgi:hypothetical protein